MESEEWGWTKGSMKVFSSSSTKVERLENDRIAKRVYVGECAGNHSVSRQQKSWIYTIEGLYVRFFSNLQGMVLLIIREELNAIC